MKKLCLMVLVGLLLAGCSSSPKGGAATYEGVGTGMNGEVKVSVTVEDGKITKVEVVEHNETPDISDPAIEKVPTAIVEANSADVDVVAGATMTSNAIMDGVKAAVESAK